MIAENWSKGSRAQACGFRDALVLRLCSRSLRTFGMGAEFRWVNRGVARLPGAVLACRRVAWGRVMATATGLASWKGRRDAAAALGAHSPIALREWVNGPLRLALRIQPAVRSLGAIPGEAE